MMSKYRLRVQDHTIAVALHQHKSRCCLGWNTSSNIGKDKSFVYDLNKERGIVRMRVAFVPRSAEIKPLFWRFVTISHSTTTNILTQSTNTNKNQHNKFTFGNKHIQLKRIVLLLCFCFECLLSIRILILKVIEGGRAWYAALVHLGCAENMLKVCKKYAESK